MTQQSITDGSPSRSIKCHACGQINAGGTQCASCGTTFSKRHPPGTVLGSYSLHEVIGEGGMGIVYSATHTRLGRRVAIKMLRSHYTGNSQAVHRFFAEARAVNKIKHPNIVAVTDFIEQAGADNYYVMELLEGTNLSALAETTTLPLARSTGIMMQVASVLDAVHKAGIVHRDIKPDNIFLIEHSGQKDFVKLVDFGVAKLTDESDDTISMHSTNPGAILGTPDYMSPEQASASPVDHRTDVYAFGVVLYKLVTRRLPHSGANFGEIVVQLLTVPVTPPRELPDLPYEVPQSLEDLIMACLAKETVDRPDSMETVSERLGEIMEEQGWIVYELNLLASGPVKARTDSMPPMRDSTESAPLPRAKTAPPIRTAEQPPIPKSIRTAEQPPIPKSEAATDQPAKIRTPPSAGEVVVWPAKERKARQRWPLIAAGAAVIAVIAIVLATRGSKPGAGNQVAAQVENEIRAADDRIAKGRLVASDGDDALDHLLAARKLEPENAGVRQRLRSIAKTYEDLAAQAIATDSLAEAAAHLQVVLTAEPDNAAAAKQMKDLEAQILARQRAPK